MKKGGSQWTKVKWSQEPAEERVTSSVAEFPPHQGFMYTSLTVLSRFLVLWLCWSKRGQKSHQGTLNIVIGSHRNYIIVLKQSYFLFLRPNKRGKYGLKKFFLILLKEKRKPLAWSYKNMQQPATRQLLVGRESAFTVPSNAAKTLLFS